MTDPFTDHIHVAFASDTVLAMPMNAAIASLLATRAPTTHLHIHVLSCGIPNRARAKIDQTIATHGDGAAHLHWHEIVGENAALLQRFFVDSDRPYPPAAYARLLLGDLVAPEHGKIIYLDSDVVTLTDLAPLWAIALGDAKALAIRDIPHDSGQCARLHRTLNAEDTARYGIDPDAPYFQSGVMVLDLNALRGGLAQEMLDLLQRYPALTFPDQDALNIVLAQAHRLVDPRWNSVTGVYWYKDGDTLPYDDATMRDLREDPFIVHYSGRPKPWEEGCTHPLAHHWQRFFEMTPWAAHQPTLWSRALDRVPRARRMIGKRISRLLKR